MSYYVDIFFVSYRVKHFVFRDVTVLYIKSISSWFCLDSNGWCKTQNRAEHSLGTYILLSIEKADQVTDFYVLESNLCFYSPPGSQSYFASPNL